MYNLAMISNSEVFNAYLPNVLSNNFIITQFNVFGLLNNALANGEEFNIILYIVSEDINHDA